MSGDADELEAVARQLEDRVFKLLAEVRRLRQRLADCEKVRLEALGKVEELAARIDEAMRAGGGKGS